MFFSMGLSVTLYIKYKLCNKTNELTNLIESKIEETLV